MIPTSGSAAVILLKYLLFYLWLSNSRGGNLKAIQPSLYEIVVLPCPLSLSLPTEFLSPTCRVMSNVAQYMTVFMANLTTDAGSTLDCFADRHSLCNNITCAEPSTGQHFNYSFQACEGPISFSISRGFSDGSFVKGSMYNRSQQILLFGKYEAQLTLNSLSENLVQFKVRLSGRQASVQRNFWILDTLILGEHIEILFQQLSVFGGYTRLLFTICCLYHFFPAWIYVPFSRRSGGGGGGDTQWGTGVLKASCSACGIYKYIILLVICFCHTCRLSWLPTITGEFLFLWWMCHWMMHCAGPGPPPSSNLPLPPPSNLSLPPSNLPLPPPSNLSLPPSNLPLPPPSNLSPRVSEKIWVDKHVFPMRAFWHGH